jgi:hypothetical protein
MIPAVSASSSGSLHGRLLSRGLPFTVLQIHVSRQCGCSCAPKRATTAGVPAHLSSAGPRMHTSALKSVNGVSASLLAASANERATVTARVHLARSCLLAAHSGGVPLASDPAEVSLARLLGVLSSRFCIPSAAKPVVLPSTLLPRPHTPLGRLTARRVSLCLLRLEPSAWLCVTSSRISTLTLSVFPLLAKGMPHFKVSTAPNAASQSSHREALLSPCSRSAEALKKVRIETSHPFEVLRWEPVTLAKEAVIIVLTSYSFSFIPFP